MLEEFEKYVSNYDLDDEKIKLKINHSYRVMELSKKYSKLLGFSKEDVALASLIGLLHDIGRFEQLKNYNTFNDSKSIDHADYGIKVLFEDGLIKKFTNNTKDYEIIEFAIRNHNKFEIEKTDNERALMHAKLIRDTDKLDILYLEGYLKELNIKASSDKITKEVMDAFYNDRKVLKDLTKNINDSILLTFAFVFDINYDICLKELKENTKYLYNQIDGEDIFKNIYNDVITYIDERIDKYARN